MFKALGPQGFLFLIAQVHSLNFLSCLSSFIQELAYFLLAPSLRSTLPPHFLEQLFLPHPLEDSPSYPGALSLLSLRVLFLIPWSTLPPHPLEHFSLLPPGALSLPHPLSTAPLSVALFIADLQPCSVRGQFRWPLGWTAWSSVIIVATGVSPPRLRGSDHRVSSLLRHIRRRTRKTNCEELRYSGRWRKSVTLQGLCLPIQN